MCFVRRRCVEAPVSVQVDGYGIEIARQCGRCHRLIDSPCLVCRKRFLRLDMHLAKSECGPHFKAGRWWRPEPPTRELVCKVVRGGQEELPL